MYGNEDDKNDDERIYTTYFNDISATEHIAGDLSDSEIDSDDVDRLYSQIYHEVCEESDPLLSDLKHGVPTQDTCSFQNKNIQSKVNVNNRDKVSLTNQKAYITDVNKNRNGLIFGTYPLSKHLLPNFDSLSIPNNRSKGIYFLDRTDNKSDKLKVGVKKNLTQSHSRPNLKDMLLNRSVDNPDSDTDHVEIIGIDRTRIENHNKIHNTKVNELDSLLKVHVESGSSVSDKRWVKKSLSSNNIKVIESDPFKKPGGCSFQSDHNKVNSNLSVCNTKVNESDLFENLENGNSVSNQVKNYSDICNANNNELDKFKNSVSSSNRSNFIVVLSDSENSSSDEKKKLETKHVKKKKVSKFIIVDNSSNSSESDSDSSSNDESHTSPLCVIDGDSASSTTTLSSLELSDSTSSSSCDGNLEQLRADIRVNVNKSQQHFLNSTIDENTFGVDKKKESVLWKICDRDRFGGNILNGRYYQPSSVRCRNCNGVGHLSKHCSTPKKMDSCILCGLGHFYRTCPNTLCYNCDAPGHDAKSCSEKRRHWYDRCNRCGMQGHLSANCPDIWRQYHLTTTDDLNVPHKEGQPNPRVFCYNCARPNHFGYECTLLRQDKYSLPTYPFVAHYGSFKSNDKKTEYENKKYQSEKRKISGEENFPRSSVKPKSPKKKRKLTTEGSQNCSPRKKCKKSHKELPETNAKNIKTVKKAKKEKNSDKVKGLESNVVVKKKDKGKKKRNKKACGTVEVDENAKQEAGHQVNDNKWWTEQYQRRQEKKRKKTERKRLKNIELRKRGIRVPKQRKKKKVNRSVVPQPNTNVKICQKPNANLPNTKVKNNSAKLTETVKRTERVKLTERIKQTERVKFTERVKRTERVKFTERVKLTERVKFTERVKRTERGFSISKVALNIVDR